MYTKIINLGEISMKTTVTNRTIRELLTDIGNETLVPRPEFQRNLVWSNKHKSAFIHTVLMGYPFPEIYVAAGEVDIDTGKRTVMLIDGQQRLTTLYQYLNGSLDLTLSNGISHYSKLTPEEQLAFLEYNVVIRDLGYIDIAEIIKVFRQINSVNYALNAMEIQNGRYDGEIKQFAEELANHSFFKNRLVFYINEIRPMGDVRFTLSVIITVMLTYFNLEKEFESFLRHYNDIFEDKQRLETEFEKVFQFINECSLPNDCRAWKKSDLFTLLVEIHRALFKSDNNIKPINVGKRLLQFYDLVNMSAQTDEKIGTENSRIQEYYLATIQGTNSRTNRISRGKIIKDVINGNFEFDTKK